MREIAPHTHFTRSSFNFDAWARLLDGFPNQAEVGHTLHGIFYGEELGFTGHWYTIVARNPQHSEPKKRAIRKDIQKRITVNVGV